MEDNVNNTTKEEKEERSLGKIMSLPLSELSEEEIERVVEERVRRNTKDKEYEDRLDVYRKEAEERINAVEETQNSIREMFKNTCDNINNKYAELVSKND